MDEKKKERETRIAGGMSVMFGYTRLRERWLERERGVR